MALFGSYEASKSTRAPSTPASFLTQIIRGAPDDDRAPHGFLAERIPHGLLRTHFHEVNQFQVFVGGAATLGRHDIELPSVHFARAFTPYGPMMPGENGISFLTLRPYRDPGRRSHYIHIPENRALLGKARNKPWQITGRPDFTRAIDGSAVWRPIPGMRDESGLAAYAASLPPGEVLTGPDPKDSGGQYIVVLDGSLSHDGDSYTRLSLAFLQPGETPVELRAGASGAQVLALHFPQAGKEPAKPRPAARRWECGLCSFDYVEADGRPEDGIAPGTKWAELPDDWTCPDCGAGKSEFAIR